MDTLEMLVALLERRKSDLKFRNPRRRSRDEWDMFDILEAIQSEMGVVYYA